MSVAGHLSGLPRTGPQRVGLYRTHLSFGGFSTTGHNIRHFLRFVKPGGGAMGSKLTVTMMSGPPSSQWETRWTKEYIR
jgi:hypothetical protein